MADVTPAKVHLMRCSFAGLALAVVFFRLLPLETNPRSWAPPDLILVLALAWSVRRPDYVPALLLAATFVIMDFLFHRPPGLMALLVLIGCEFLKTRAQPHREATFLAEWLAAAVVIAAIVLANRFVLFVLAVEQAPFGLSIIEMLATVMAYPLAALFSQNLLGVRKLSPAEADALGARA